MNAREWAEKLNGREYGEEMNADEEKQAEQDGVIIAFGASDDLLEIRGVIDDEIGAWEGTEILITPDFTIFNEDLNSQEFKYNSDQIKQMKSIKAVWSPESPDVSWLVYLQDSTVETFEFDIMEDGEVYCQGVVFMAKDLYK